MRIRKIREFLKVLGNGKYPKQNIFSILTVAAHALNETKVISSKLASAFQSWISEVEIGEFKNTNVTLTQAANHIVKNEIHVNKFVSIGNLSSGIEVVVVT